MTQVWHRFRNAVENQHPVLQELKEILSLIQSVIKGSIQLLLRETFIYIISRIYTITRIVLGTIKRSAAVVYINALVIEIYFVIKPRARMGLTHVSLQW